MRLSLPTSFYGNGEPKFPSLPRFYINLSFCVWRPGLRCIVNAGWSVGWVSAIDLEGRTIWIVDAHRGDGKRFIVHSDEILTAFVEHERQALTVTFYLESIQ